MRITVLKNCLLCVLAVSLFAGCDEPNSLPAGLALTESEGGPKIIFDLDAEPLPEIPLPNNIATRLDSSSPTGRRLNISMQAPTDLEEELRELANNVDGWGTFAPISVSFSKPLDVADIYERQNDRDVGNDVIYVVNIDEESEGFGEIVELDMGGGLFPITLRNRSNYFDNDPRVDEWNLLFETVDEDINGDGILQPEEDTDGDGVLDRPNLLPGGTDTRDHLMTFYERETNTLIARPRRPLREQTTYAVVLTKRIRGLDRRPDDGKPAPPIESPFQYINHTRQTKELEPLFDLLPQLGLTVEDVAFTWSFSTQSVTLALETVRRGLYGHGSMAYLNDEYPADMKTVWAFRGETSEKPRHVMFGEDVKEIIQLALGVVFDDLEPESTDAMLELTATVDYYISGSYDVPYFLVDRDGLANEHYRDDDDETWDIDPVTGEATHAPLRVSYWCAIPKKELAEDPSKPFPVAFYGHGYTSARFEMLGFAATHARAGIATCSTDATGHGLVIPDEIGESPIVLALLESLDLELAFKALTAGQARDLNNDGLVDSGGDYWSANTFHTRDVVRQSIVDWIAMIRILRSFDGERRWKLEDEEGAVVLEGIAGDFNGDGKVDLGGWDTEYYVWGQSLGGFVSALTAAVEPAVRAGAPTSGGAGLLDIAVRTTQGGIPEAVWLRLMGPLVVGLPNSADPTSTDVYFVAIDVNKDRRVYITTLTADELAPGDRIRITNLDSFEFDEALIRENRRFRVGVAADAMRPTEKGARFDLINATEPVIFEGNDALEHKLGDPIQLEVFAPGETAPKRVINTFESEEPVEWQGTAFGAGSVLVAPSEGFGFKRQSPDLRRFIGIGQMIIEPADPANYAAKYLDPIDYTDIEPDLDPQRNVLVIATVGDSAVPVHTGVAMARAAGYLEPRDGDGEGETPDDMLIDNFVMEGISEFDRFGLGSVLYDIDDLDNGTDEFNAPSPNPPLRATVTLPDGTQGGMRLPYIRAVGEHGFFIPSPQKDFDIDSFMANQVTHYFRTRMIIDDPCLEDSSCDFIKPLPED